MNGEEKLIAYVEDVVPSGAEHGNIAVFGDGGSLADSGKKPSDFASETDLDALRGLSSQNFTELFGMVENEDAFQAYNSDYFHPGPYEEGQYCRYEDAGYRCISGGEYDVFDPSAWKMVISASGVKAIDELLSAYSNGGMSRLLDLAPEFDPNHDYLANQLAVKDGILQRSTVAGRGVLALFTGSTVEETIANRIASLNKGLSDHVSDSSVHVSSADRSSWDSKVDSDGSGYSISDTETNGVEVTTESGSNQKKYLFSKPGSDTSDTVVRRSDLPSVTAPSASANPGDVAGAKDTGSALEGKRGLKDFGVDKTGWILSKPEGTVEWLKETQSYVWENSDGSVVLTSVPDSGDFRFYIISEGGNQRGHARALEDAGHVVISTDDDPPQTYVVVRGGRIAVDSDISAIKDEMPAPGIIDPSMDGTASAGSSEDYSRSDHVHPHDTSKQDVLTFDSAPTDGSQNPVTSGGVKAAIDATLPLDTGNGKTVVGPVTFNQGSIGGSIPRVVFSPNSSPYSIQVLGESIIAWCPSASDLAVMTLDLRNILNNRRIEIVTVQEGSGQTWEIPIDPSRMSGPNVVARLSDIPDVSRKRNYPDLTYVIEDMWVVTVGSISVELYKTGDNTWASNSGKVTLERETRGSTRWRWNLEDEDGELVGGDDTNLSGEKITNVSDPTSITSILLYGNEDDYVASCVKHSADTMIAVESGMSITPGTGGDSDKTTIQLKSGLSATVLTQHQSLEGYAKLEDLEGLDLGADYTIETLSPTISGSQITYDLKNRCVNVIEVGSTSAGFSISMNQPDAETLDGTPVAREYLIVLSSELSSDVTVSVSGNIKDYAGNATSIVAFAGTTSIYRVFEFSRGSGRFVATGPNDPAYSAVKEIERALDDLMADGGSGVYTPGLFVLDEDTGLYHKVTAVSDQETGEVNLGVDDTPVSK